MAKTRRLRKKRGTRRRKQRGGSTIRVKFPMKGKVVEKNISFTNENTPRQILDRFLTNNLKEEMKGAPLYNTSNVPLFRFSGEQLPKFRQPVLSPQNWNKRTPFFEGFPYYLQYKGDFPSDNKKVEEPVFSEEEKLFSSNYYLAAPLQEKARIEKAHIPLLRQVLNHYKETGAKIILGSSIINRGKEWHLPSIKQQFKFMVEPKTPILLIDPAFFSDTRYEFFDYVKFEEGVLSGIDPKRVKVYQKTKGDFTASTSNKVTEEEKLDYLKKLNQQANTYGFDPTKDELEICCIRVPISGDVYSKQGDFYTLVKEFGDQFKVYDFGAESTSQQLF